MWKPRRFLTCLLILNLWLICASKPLDKAEKANKDEENVWVQQIFDLSLKTLSLLRPYLIPTQPSRTMSETTTRPMNITTLPISGIRKFDPWGGK